MADLIVHLARATEWEAGRACGVYVPAEYETDGFIHCSRPEQAHLPANAVFSRTPGLVLLWIDAGAVDADLVEEDGFPHLYAPLDVDTVVAVSALRPWEPGGFALPPGPST
jgi:uncharacterized protein (DUF952 family)